MNDGRPPDTARQLIKPVSSQIPKSVMPSNLSRQWQYMRPQLHQDGIRLILNNSFQSYPWNGSASCWFDTSMEVLFFCSLHMSKTRFRILLSENEATVPQLGHILEHIEARKQAYESVESIWELEKKLRDLRDGTADRLHLDLFDQKHPLVLIVVLVQLLIIK
jgi:hypothetical protein